MKIFILLSRFPYPLEKGDKLRAYHQIKELSKEHRIFLCCLSDKMVAKSDLKELEKYCDEIRIIRLNRLKIIWRLFLGIFSKRPFQYHYFYDRSAQKKINKFIEHYLPKHIFCQLIRTGSYVKHYSVIPKTLDYMDALSEGMQRRASVSRFPMKILFDLEAHRLRHFEAELFPYFDQHCIISEQDRNAILHPKKQQINIIANGISEAFFTNTEVSKSYDILFCGNMNYSPNIRAAKFIVEDILPLLNNKGHMLKVLIAGANPANQVKALANEQVFVSGWIDDIRDAYSGSKIFVAPMFIGSGLQNKLLEAMAQGLPCVTTGLANNALGAKANDEILIAEKKEDFVEQIHRLSSSRDEAKRVGSSGREFVRKNFSWEHQSKLLSQLFVTEGR